MPTYSMPQLAGRILPIYAYLLYPLPTHSYPSLYLPLNYGTLLWGYNPLDLSDL